MARRTTRRDYGGLLAPCFLGAVFATAILSVPGVALADTVTVPSSTALAWTDPAHHSPLELLASRIASHIAGHAVSVHCDAPREWVAAIEAAGGNPSSEDGSVSTSWNSLTGQLMSLPSIAELNGERVCIPLARFANAVVKSTKCLAMRGNSGKGGSEASSSVRGSLARRSATSARSAKNPPARTGGEQPARCYLSAGKSPAQTATAFWLDYGSYAVAILTLSHEAIHLGGVVGGQLPGGLAVGDQQAEAKANCYGMQWMPYVAEQLGDTPHNAQAIAEYYWDNIYPNARTSDSPQYWSAQCARHGGLDLQLPQTPVWP